MQYMIFSEPQESYKVGILIKGAGLRKQPLEHYYVNKLVENGASKEDCIAFELKYDKNKASIALMKECLAEVLEEVKQLQIKYLYVADAKYFKQLTGESADSNMGNLVPVKGMPEVLATYGVNHQVFSFNQNLGNKYTAGLYAIIAHARGTYSEVGAAVLGNVEYIGRDEPEKARAALQRLLSYPELAADIEAFSLSMFDAGIGTIGFAYSEHDAVQIQCDYKELVEPTEDGLHGEYVVNDPMRLVFKEFFTAYKGRIAWHRANYDVKVIIYTLWMAHDLDYDGMLAGLDVMCPNMDDTKVIAYLALNTTADVNYGLKSLGQEHAGNWAQDDIKDIRKIPLKQLMQYNAVDAVTTLWVKHRYSVLMVRDKQEELYRGLFLDSLRLIIHAELVGMPMCEKTLLEVEQELIGYRAEYLQVIDSHPKVAELNFLLQTDAMVKANAKLKTIQHPLSKYSGVKFNPNSPSQVGKLLYEVLGLPIIDKTSTGQPATGAKIIKRLVDHTAAAPYKDLLQALVDYSAVDKVLTSFIPAFKAGRRKADGMLYLHGSYNLGGTISGRLSSSEPNMQNIPSGSKYGKAIKRIFRAPPGWLFGGADFASLEDRINALLTRDTNKLKVYTDGYDGHCLRAYSYWRDKFPDIEDTVESINSIQDKYKDLRNRSKNPTFLLTYGGTAAGLVRTLGFPKDEAEKIEQNYNTLYAESKKWVSEEMEKAAQCGYVELAFGLRLRTPLLSNTLLGIRATPKEAEAEARSAGNAVSGQSWGLLNNRAAVAFMKRVNASKWRGKVHIVALIHDAIYPIFVDDPECAVWVNNVLCEEMSWQDDPKIYHDQVKIGANLDLFWPTWKDALTLDYPITVERLKEQCREHAAAIRAKEV